MYDIKGYSPFVTRIIDMKWIDKNLKNGDNKLPYNTTTKSLSMEFVYTKMET